MVYITLKAKTTFTDAHYISGDRFGIRCCTLKDVAQALVKLAIDPRYRRYYGIGEGEKLNVDFSRSDFSSLFRQDNIEVLEGIVDAVNERNRR